MTPLSGFYNLYTNHPILLTQSSLFRIVQLLQYKASLPLLPQSHNASRRTRNDGWLRQQQPAGGLDEQAHGEENYRGFQRCYGAAETLPRND